MKDILVTSQGLPRSSPESVGIASEHITAFLQKLQDAQYDIHSLQIIRHGRLIFSGAAAPYTLQSPHRMLSAAKAIIAAGVLFAIDEGKLSMEEPVAPWFSDLLPENPDPRLMRMTLYDLLTMQTGQETDDAFMHFLTHQDDDLCRNFFHTAWNTEPGTHFFYNNSVPHILFSITERAVGRAFMDYLNEKLCRPLDMTITAQNDLRGVYDPVTTVMSSDDFLRLTLWFLQEGSWNGQQLIAPELIRMACTQQTFSGNGEGGYRNGNGYCMQLWKNVFGGVRMDGGGVQEGLILPEHDMAVAIMCNASDGEFCLRSFYEEVLAKVSGKPLPENPHAETILEKAIQGMSRAPKNVSSHSECESDFSQTHVFIENRCGLEQLSLVREADHLLLCVTAHGAKHDFRIGLNGCWEENPTHVLVTPDTSIQNQIYGSDPNHCFASGGWKNDRLFLFTLKSVASMGEYRFQILWSEQVMEVDIPEAVSGGMLKEPTCFHAVSVRKEGAP